MKQCKQLEEWFTHRSIKKIIFFKLCLKYISIHVKEPIYSLTLIDWSQSYAVGYSLKVQGEISIELHLICKALGPIPLKSGAFVFTNPESYHSEGPDLAAQTFLLHTQAIFPSDVNFCKPASLLTYFRFSIQGGTIDPLDKKAVALQAPPAALFVLNGKIKFL